MQVIEHPGRGPVTHGARARSALPDLVASIFGQQAKCAKMESLTTTRQSTLVIIPAYNEEASVGTVVASVVEFGFDVVVVYDGSADATGSVARAGGATVLRLPFNLGVGGALRCGFRWAVRHGYDAVIQCDADGQHDPAELEALLVAAVERDAHLLIGSRFLGTGGFKATRLRRVSMRVLGRIASRAAGRRITDASSGFRVIREPLLTEFARAFPVHYLGDTFEVLVQAGNCGYRVDEIPVTMRHRTTGMPSSGPVASVRNLIRVFAALTLGSSLQFRRFDASMNPSMAGRTLA